jgi:HEPN domain-containing protein
MKTIAFDQPGWYYSSGKYCNLDYGEGEVLALGNRVFDWFKQALQDLEQAEESSRSGRHEWACFAAQQAAEKAVKALHLYLGQEAWGHVVAKLLKELPQETAVNEAMVDKGRVLDNFYIPTRYPSSHPAGAPFEHYGKLQSEEAIRYACEIIEFVRNKMA